MFEFESNWWVIGALALLAVAFALYAQQLRGRLRLAERRAHEIKRSLDVTMTELKRLSGLDALTGAANRGAFDGMFEREWARALRSHHSLAIVMADIDHFKAHNDNYGHPAGDECLRQVAAALQRGVRRPADLVARYGGEEFAVILPGADAAGAAAVAERMRREVQALKLAHVNRVTGHDVTVSLGVAAAIPGSGATPAALLAAADDALYRAKAVGRNQVIASEAVESNSQTITL